MKRRTALLSVAIAALLPLLASCDTEGIIYRDLDELGAVEKEISLPASSGLVEIQIYANKEGSAFLDDDVDWLLIQNPSFEGDQIIVVGYTENLSDEERSAMIHLQTATRNEDITIIQAHK